MLKGRSDKKFCSAKCKSIYHHKLRNDNNKVITQTDRILHRNRSILLELLGTNKNQIQVPQTRLDQTNFKKQFMTGYYHNAQGKRYHIIYDFAWMQFSNGNVLIRKRSQ